jgi:hypothetical protein
MAKTLKRWMATDVANVRRNPLHWLSQYSFVGGPSRPLYSVS